MVSHKTMKNLEAWLIWSSFATHAYIYIHIIFTRMNMCVCACEPAAPHPLCVTCVFEIYLLIYCGFNRLVFSFSLICWWDSWAKAEHRRHRYPQLGFSRPLKKCAEQLCWWLADLWHVRWSDCQTGMFYATPHGVAPAYFKDPTEVASGRLHRRPHVTEALLARIHCWSWSWFLEQHDVRRASTNKDVKHGNCGARFGSPEEIIKPEQLK